MVVSHVTPMEWLFSTWRPEILHTFTRIFGWCESSLSSNGFGSSVQENLFILCTSVFWWIPLLCFMRGLSHIEDAVSLCHKCFGDFCSVCRVEVEKPKRNASFMTHNSCQALFVGFSLATGCFCLRQWTEFVVLPSCVVIVFLYFGHITEVCCTSDLL